MTAALEPYTETAANVAAFFDSYRVAFDRLDADDIAKHFYFPTQLTLDIGGKVLALVATRADMLGSLERLLANYRRIRFGSAMIRQQSTVQISTSVAHVVVDWELVNCVGEGLYSFVATYVLAKIEGALRITAVAHNEVPRYRECLLRQQDAASQKSAANG